MSYLHTIALARELFSNAHFVAVRQMVEPLLDAADVDRSTEIALRSLLAGAELLGFGKHAAALSLLRGYSPETAGVDSDDADVAEIELWLGWALVEGGETSEQRRRGLALLADAVRRTRNQYGVELRCWALIAYIRSLVEVGAPHVAVSYLPETRRLTSALDSAAIKLEMERIETEVRELEDDREDIPLRPTASPEFAREMAVLHHAVAAGLPTVIVGEAGVLKTSLARAAVAATGAKAVAIDCRGNVRPESTLRQLDGELSTLILEHIDSLDQAKQNDLLSLLRGTWDPLRKDLRSRLVCTTSLDPDELVRGGTLAVEFFHMLAAVRVAVPPLRHRKEDVDLIVRAMLCGRASGATNAVITDRALDALRYYSWPGNDGELIGLLSGFRQFMAVDPTPVVDIDNLPASVSASRTRHHTLKRWIDQQLASGGHDLDDVLAETERVLIESTLQETGGQVAAAADILGLTRQGLYKKMKRLEVDPAGFHEHVSPDLNSQPA